MDILGLNVYQVEQILADTIAAALLLILGDGIELIDAEYFDISKRDLTCAITCSKLTIKTKWCATGGKTESERTLLSRSIVLCNGLGDKIVRTCNFKIASANKWSDYF